MKRKTNSYSDEEIIEDVKNVIEKTGDSSLKNYKKVSNKYSLCAIQGHFGSWTQLLNKLGIEPKVHYFATKEDLVKDIISVIEKTGNSGRENYLSHGKYSRAIIKRIFKTWNNALTELGYEINMFKPGQYTREDILNNYRELCNEHQKMLTAAEFRKLGKFSQPIIDNTFGSFSNMRKELGLYFFINEYSDDDVKEILQKIYDEYGFVNEKLINETRLNKTTICNKYKTVEKCCKRFGFPYKKTSLQELFRIKICKLLNMDCETEKTFDWLRNPKTNYPLRVDFYFKSLKLVVEIDGEQHDKFNKFFHGSIENFVEMQQRDKVKESLLKAHGFNVIRIREKDNINQLLKDYIK